MPKADIIISQTGKGPFAAGVAARGLDLYSVGSESIFFTNSDEGHVGVTKYEWTLLEAPPGSAAVLVSSTSRTCELQADEYGRYVVALRVNDLGNNTPGYSVTVAGCSFPSLGTATWGDELGDWDLPAFLEGNYANWEDYFSSNNARGAQAELWRILYQIRSGELPIGGGGGGASPYLEIPLSGALTQRSDLAAPSWADAGYLRAIDMDDFTFGAVQFGVVLFREGAVGTAKARLYDVTNAVAVTGTELTTTGGPITLLTSSLTVGSGAGNMRDDADTLYKVQIEITGGTPTVDFVNIFDAFLFFNPSGS